MKIPVNEKKTWKKKSIREVDEEALENTEYLVQTSSTN